MLVGGDWAGDLTGATDGDLERARDAAVVVREVVVGMGAAFDEAFGPDAFGLTAMRTLLGERNAFNDAVTVFALLRAARVPELGEQLKLLLAALPQARALKAMSDQLPELRQDPQIAHLFAPEIMRRAVADRESFDAHLHRIEQLSRQELASGHAPS